MRVVSVQQTRVFSAKAVSSHSPGRSVTRALVNQNVKSFRVNGPQLPKRSRKTCKVSQEDAAVTAINFDDGCPIYDEDGWIIGWKETKEDCQIPPNAVLMGVAQNESDVNEFEGGCLNPDAVNYDPIAGFDNGTCVIPYEDCENDACDTAF
ncbi:hypothetical protein CYMTET_8958 [Cymbomonas tetramitiformis]|uniref:Uncharacterized protein n=1 Tax=Cymbomonas tetramitiformis TaxID=36881 RepID=A0AAE0GSA2_9CHLO|nr:hypothetical protein CYMTET_8958 [Cymbomonas tetramitiformis]